MRLQAIGASAVIYVVALALPGRASAQTGQIQVHELSGNPSCATLNASTGAQYAGITSNYGFKIDSGDNDVVTSGRYELNGTTGTFTGGAPADSINWVDLQYTGNQWVSWTSSLGIDAVIVKGGDGARVYVLESNGSYVEMLGGTSFHSPYLDPPANTKIPAISHVEFCYDYEVTVTKTADTTFKRTHSWTLEHSVPSPIDMFTGDSSSATYQIEWTKTTVDSDWYVSGVITVANDTPFPVTITSVSDSLAAVGRCSFPVTVQSGDSLECTYGTGLPDGGSRVNVATATTDPLGRVGGNTGSAPVVFDTPTVIGHDAVNVKYGDGNGTTASTSGTRSYPRPVACDADQGSTTRIAALEAGDPVGTIASAPATLAVNCHKLIVAASGSGSFRRDYTWTIAKSAAVAALTLDVNTTAAVNYSVALTAASADSGHTVTGKLTVQNPAPIDATLNGASVDLSGVGLVALDCTFPAALPAGATLTCNYTAAVTSDAARALSASAILANTPSGTTTFTGGGAAAFAAPAEFDKCVAVSDAFNGAPAIAVGDVCATPGAFSTLLPYANLVGPYSSCSSTSTTVSNTASFAASSGASGSSTAAVTVNVPCPPPPPPPPPPASGCTRTIGYWKVTVPTHQAALGAALESGIWLGTVGGSKSEAVTSVSQAQAILSSSDSNGINKLRAQLLATKLNIASGAANTVASTITAADAFLANNGPEAWKTLTAAQRKVVDQWKNTLDAYNNGLLGVGHCQ